MKQDQMTRYKLSTRNRYIVAYFGNARARVLKLYCFTIVEKPCSEFTLDLLTSTICSSVVQINTAILCDCR